MGGAVGAFILAVMTQERGALAGREKARPPTANAEAVVEAAVGKLWRESAI